ncbi:mannonate dehydratase [Psychromonas arctica]
MSVVERGPVHQESNTQPRNFQQWRDNYKQTIENLAKSG